MSYKELSLIESIMQKDPAAKSKLEVLLCYPGVHAVYAHRLAHYLFVNNMKLMGRIVSQLARFFTGIEIHPGAVIGKRLFIDHGFGVIIGETAIVGDDVTLYQGVTLGGTGKESGKRHPTIGNNVLIAAGAKILGPFSIGDYSKVGAGSVVLKEVPANCTVVGVPGRIVIKENQKVKPWICDMNQVNFPNPVEMEFVKLRNRIENLEKTLLGGQENEAV